MKEATGKLAYSSKNRNLAPPENKIFYFVESIPLRLLMYRENDLATINYHPVDKPRKHRG